MVFVGCVDLVVFGCVRLLCVVVGLGWFGLVMMFVYFVIGLVVLCWCCWGWLCWLWRFVVIVRSWCVLYVVFWWCVGCLLLLRCCVWMSFVWLLECWFVCGWVIWRVVWLCWVVWLCCCWLLLVCLCCWWFVCVVFGLGLVYGWMCVVVYCVYGLFWFVGLCSRLSVWMSFVRLLLLICVCCVVLWICVWWCLVCWLG